MSVARARAAANQLHVAAAIDRRGIRTDGRTGGQTPDRYIDAYRILCGSVKNNHCGCDCCCCCCRVPRMHSGRVVCSENNAYWLINLHRRDWWSDKPRLRVWSITSRLQVINPYTVAGHFSLRTSAHPVRVLRVQSHRVTVYALTIIFHPPLCGDAPFVEVILGWRNGSSRPRDNCLYASLFTV